MSLIVNNQEQLTYSWFLMFILLEPYWFTKTKHQYKFTDVRRYVSSVDFNMTGLNALVSDLSKLDEMWF
jgi:hypothetical protein